MGLEKLQASAAAVANMQNELTALQPQLVKTVGEVEELMARIGKEKAEVVEPKAEVPFLSRAQTLCDQKLCIDRSCSFSHLELLIHVQKCDYETGLSVDVVYAWEFCMQVASNTDLLKFLCRW